MDDKGVNNNDDQVEKKKIPMMVRRRKMKGKVMMARSNAGVLVSTLGITDYQCGSQ